MNQKMTAPRRAFLDAAIANEGRIIRLLHGPGWVAGSVRVQESMGEILCVLGWIAAVKKHGGRSTVLAEKGYLYTVTDAARVALGEAA